MHIERKLNIIPIGKHAGKFIENLSDLEVHAMWSWWKQNMSTHHFYEIIESEHFYREIEQANALRTSNRLSSSGSRKRKIQKFDKCKLQCDTCKQKRERKASNSKKRLNCKCGGKLVLIETILAPVQTTKQLLTKSQKSDKTFIYFVTDDAEVFVKIGRSNDVKSRVATLQTSHPRKLRVVFTTEETPVLTELTLHKRFAKYRRQGEWFSFCDEIRSFIKQMDELKRGA